ncbi:signal peptidase I [uncultured Senegalimassilia sp.]|uniref:signal peptidase I n=1 Tax=uncultured Senegalimassilia sp. TaxID=1714350 RepID=UPI0026744F45|nr:signal peptidase I [uncultured Senegalimassilia sp.]
MKHVLRVVNALAAVVIVVALVVLLRATFTPAGEVPTIGGYGILRTLTGSMEPAIPVHSLVVVVQQTDPAELQVGDTITFEATEGALDGALNTHRIVQIDEGPAGPVFHTKGDANAVEDAQTVSADHVIGRVVFVSSGLGVIVSLLTNPLLFFPLIVVPLAVLLVLEIRKMVKSAREVAQAEEQAALAQAVEIIKRQREKQAVQQEAGEQPVDAACGSDDGPPAGEHGETDEVSESDSLEKK